MGKGVLIAGIFNGLQKLSIPLFGVLSTMILAHKSLSKIEMGVWSLFLVITSFVELIRQALVKTSLIRFVNHSNEDEQKYVLSAALFLNTVITVLLLLIILIGASFFDDLLQAEGLNSMLHIYIIGMLLLIPFSHLEWIMYSKLQFQGLFWTFFLRQGASLLLMLVLLLFGFRITLNELVIFYCAGIFVGGVFAFKYTKQQLKYKFIFSIVWIKRLWNYGKYVFGSGFSTLIFSNASQLMISPLLGSTSYTASQGIAARVVNIADMPSQVLSDILFPKSARKENANNRELIKYYYEKTVGATLFFAVPMVIFVLLFPRFIIFVIAGTQYYDAVPYLQIISISGLFLAFLKQYGVILDSTGRPEINFKTITFLALLHISLSYIFILQCGFLGAAYALILSHFIGFIITQIILYRLYKIEFLNCFRYAFKVLPELKMIVKDNFQWNRSK